VRNTRGAGIVLVLFASGWITAACFAQGINTTNPNLPPDTGDYVGLSMSYHGPGLTILLQDPHLHPVAASAIRTPSGPDEIEFFSAILNAQATVNLNPPFPTTASGQERTLTRGKIGNTTGVFPAEMLELNLSGSTILGPYMIRESPTLASTGLTTISDLGGGLYHIDSFFDVFTELSIDGGQSWIPSDSSTRLTLLPEPGVMGMIVAVLGLISRRRSRGR
jgi:hypothetical protein